MAPASDGKTEAGTPKLRRSLNPKSDNDLSRKAAADSAFDLRISFGLRPSGFGFGMALPPRPRIFPAGTGSGLRTCGFTAVSSTGVVPVTSELKVAPAGTR